MSAFGQKQTLIRSTRQLASGPAQFGREAEIQGRRPTTTSYSRPSSEVNRKIAISNNEILKTPNVIFLETCAELCPASH